MKTIVYTAIIGNYDNVVTPLQHNKDYEYILFTNNVEITSDFWKVVYISDSSLSNKKLARKIKIRPDLYLPKHDLSIWLDANIIQNCNLESLVECLSGFDMLTMKHPSRNCIYQEVNACNHFKKDNLDLMIKQTNRYKANNYPENNGLIASGILIRRNKQDVKDLMRNWWYEVSEYSHRDQLSFNYVLSKFMGFKLVLVPYSILQTHFKYTRHNVQI